LRSRSQAVLHPNEVDAFLATAVEVQNHSSNNLQSLEVNIPPVHGFPKLAHYTNLNPMSIPFTNP